MVLYIMICVIGFGYAVLEGKRKGLLVAVVSVICTVAFEIGVAGVIRISEDFFIYSDEDKQVVSETYNQPESESYGVETTESEIYMSSEEEIESSAETTTTEPVQENLYSKDYIEDITGVVEITGRIVEEDQEISYRYVPQVGGTYHFYTDSSAGVDVWIEIGGENGAVIESGRNKMTVNLESEKIYVVKIEYLNGLCDYMLKIGVPKEREEITGKTSFAGTITYENQVDQYFYTAPVSGIYHFYTNRSAGGDVWIKLNGENGNFIDSGRNQLTMDLEKGKSYRVSVEEMNGYCDYQAEIGVPIEIVDITGAVGVEGRIFYQGQKDQYLYTPSIRGLYHFGTELSSGGEVRIRISGENGKSIDDNRDELTIELEAGKTYMLGVEYTNAFCDYCVEIGVPNEIIDITGEDVISGNITYKDQVNRYYYQALASGDYCFTANCGGEEDVRIRIRGENGKSLRDGKNSLKMELKKGEIYILSVEYKTNVCSYVVTIDSP